MKNLLSLFSGIGSFERALDIVGVDYELSNYCEICKYQSKLYSTIHSVDENKNLWDIRDLDISQLDKDVDIITHGSPCTSYSVMGKQEGGDEGSGTKSSLMWHTVEIVKNKRPEYVIWENVPNVATSKKHKHNFEKYLDDLEKLGYTNYWEILNSKDFDIPQNRRRVFVVSIRNDTNNNFKFPKGGELSSTIKNYLIDDVKEKYYLSNEKTKGSSTNKNNNKLGNLNYYNFKQEDIVYNINSYAPTITASGANSNIKVIENQDNLNTENPMFRKLTPFECFRLMGFKDNDYYKGKQALENTFYNGNDKSDTRMYKAAGNSIVVNVLVAIFKNLFKEMII